MEFSSSDEELLDLVDRIARPRLYTRRRNYFEFYSEEDFKTRYRLSKNIVHNLENLFQNDLMRMTNRSYALSPLEQILIALRFYATGAFQIVIGDNAHVHKSTVCKVIKKVSELIAQLRPEFVKMPESVDEIQQIKLGFHQIRGFPNVLGCVDGTHVPIISPGGENAELFRNRKGFFSINVQESRPARKDYNKLSGHEEQPTRNRADGERVDNNDNPSCKGSNDSVGNTHDSDTDSSFTDLDMDDRDDFSDDSDYEEALTCNVCDRSFATPKQLSSHKQKKRHFGCSACDSLFPSLMALEHHKEEFEHWSEDDDIITDSEEDDDDTVISEECERLL